MLNCLIKDNDSSVGGGVYEAGGFIINSTIIDNYASYSSGGIYRGGVSPNVGCIYNSIIYNNSAYIGPNHYPLYPTAHTMLYYCYTDDPQFADSDGRLSSDSPCVDTGGNMVLCDTDLDGFAIVRGAGIDIGAYETPSQINIDYEYLIRTNLYVDITWDCDEPVNVWVNSSGIYTEFSMTDKNWVLKATTVTSPWQLVVPRRKLFTTIYVYLTHANETNPIYENDSLITIILLTSQSW